MNNQSIFIGRVGKEPDMNAAIGRGVCKFSIAVSDDYKDKDGEWVKVTDWFNCELWGRRAERFNQNVSKGMMVQVIGKMKTKEWEDQQGNKRRGVFLRAQDYRIIATEDALNAVKPKYQQEESEDIF